MPERHLDFPHFGVIRTINPNPHMPQNSQERTIALRIEVEHWSLTTLREKLVKIRANIFRHGLYVTFRLANFAVSRALFADILRLTDGSRPRPAPT